MINAHDLDIVPGGVEPFEESIDFTQRMSIEQNEGIMELLRELNANIDRVANYTPRQLSKEPPACIDLGPLSGKNGAGTATGAVHQTTQKFRVTNIVLGGGAAGDNFRLFIGSLQYNFFGTGTMVALPFEIQIDRGVDINVRDITTPANVAWTFMIFGYSE